MMESKASATAENDCRIAQNAQKVGSTYRKQPTSDECVEVSCLTPIGAVSGNLFFRHVADEVKYKNCLFRLAKDT